MTLPSLFALHPDIRDLGEAFLERWRLQLGAHAPHNRDIVAGFTFERSDVVPQLDLYDRNWPLWTYSEIVPPAKFAGSM